MNKNLELLENSNKETKNFSIGVLRNEKIEYQETLLLAGNINAIFKHLKNLKIAQFYPKFLEAISNQPWSYQKNYAQAIVKQIFQSQWKI